VPEGYARALELAVRLAQEAGAVLRAEFHRPGGPRGSHAHAPADDEAEAILRRGLTAAFPDWGYRGEETRPHLPARDPAGHVWLVDPNDGTADYLRGQRGSAVSIGLVRRGEPVLGVVFAHCAPDDDGDLLAWAEGCGPLQRNGVALARSDWPAALDAETVALLSQGAERRPADNLRVLAPARFRALPSIAYRLALAAAGEGAAAMSLHTPGDWDYGGGHALLRGAGGVFVNERGQPVTYAPDGASRTQRCYGGAPAVVAELRRRPWQRVLQGAPPPWPDPALPFDFLRLRPGENVADAKLLARAQGCLLGLLAADALTVASSAEGNGASRALFPGQPSAAGEAALLLARSLVHEGRYDPEIAARVYGWWYRTKPGVDEATARALGAIPRRSAPASAAERAHAEPRAAVAARAAVDSAARHASVLARVAPLGVWGRCQEPETLAIAARLDSALTHPASADACAALVIAIAHAVRTGDGAAAHRAATAWATETGADAATCAALAAAQTQPGDGESDEAPAVLQHAMFQLLHASGWEAGVQQPPRAGASAHLYAAVSGALLGAAHGRDAVPLAWRRLVLSCRPTADPPLAPHPRPRPVWATDLFALAERLLTAGEPDRRS
jgi:fructose-1,6-bisphosphatase/inositol monophosphatase family enzyme/ADP-ribosylglycohydrolase